MMRLEPTSSKMLVGRADHYTIEATSLAAWPFCEVSRMRLFQGTFSFEVYVCTKSTAPKTMATDTFTHNSKRTKTLKKSS